MSKPEAAEAVDRQAEAQAEAQAAPSQPDTLDEREGEACTLLLNPEAGALHRTPSPEQMQQMADDMGLPITVQATESADDMRERVRKLRDDGATRIGIGGGDGTIALAVQELAHTDTALGIVPLGTNNNLVDSLGIPLEIPRALRILCSGEPRQIDLGKINDTWFIEAAGVGLYADILAMYGKGTNKSLFRGLWAMARAMFSFSPHRLCLTLDEQQVVERAVLCEVTNTRRVGTSMPVAPEARLSDGALDVVVFGNLTRSEIFAYYRAVQGQTHLLLPKVHTFQAQRIDIDASVKMNVRCDSNIVASTPVTITNDSGALTVLVEPL